MDHSSVVQMAVMKVDMKAVRLAVEMALSMVEHLADKMDQMLVGSMAVPKVGPKDRWSVESMAAVTVGSMVEY